MWLSARCFVGMAGKLQMRDECGVVWGGGLPQHRGSWQRAYTPLHAWQRTQAAILSTRHSSLPVKHKMKPVGGGAIWGGCNCPRVR